MGSIVELDGGFVVVFFWYELMEVVLWWNYENWNFCFLEIILSIGKVGVFVLWDGYWVVGWYCSGDRYFDLVGGCKVGDIFILVGNVYRLVCFV